MTSASRDLILQNLKLIKLLKATNHTDREIASQVGVKVVDLLEMVETDDYFREMYETAAGKVINEIEAEFLKRTLESLEEGKTDDAKFVLTRRHPDYKADNKLEISVKSIDDIIKEKSKEEDEEGS